MRLRRLRWGFPQKTLVTFWTAVVRSQCYFLSEHNQSYLYTLPRARVRRTRLSCSWEPLCRVASGLQALGKSCCFKKHPLVSGACLAIARKFKLALLCSAGGSVAACLCSCLLPGFLPSPDFSSLCVAFLKLLCLNSLLGSQNVRLQD